MRKKFSHFISTAAIMLTCALSAISANAASIRGTSSGSCYFWTSSRGGGYYYTIPEGSEITYVGQTENNRTLVMVNGNYGWVTAKFVSSAPGNAMYGQPAPAGNIGTPNVPPQGQPAPAAAHYIGGASSGAVYFWKSSVGTGYYDTIPNGTPIVVLSQSVNGRTQVQYNGITGWITSKFIH